MATTQFMTNADSTADPNKPAAFQNSVWLQEGTKDLNQSGQLAWNQEYVFDNSSCGPGNIISYHHAYGAYQSEFGANLQPETSWWYGNYDQAVTVGSQEVDQMGWGAYGGLYYPVVPDFRGGGFTGRTDVDTLPWAGLARTTDPWCWSATSPWIASKWYQASGDIHPYAAHCVKEEADDRDVIPQVNGPTAASAPLIHQVRLTSRTYMVDYCVKVRMWIIIF